LEAELAAVKDAHAAEQAALSESRQRELRRLAGELEAAASARALL
jgi:hypothetical protein